MGDRKALHTTYHDHHYGFPVHNDNELFCRLVMEINQAGLSWETILKKEVGFRKAYNNFNINKVAAYKNADIQRLLSDAGIIRNRLKVYAAIYNARAIIQLQYDYGSFEKWLEDHFPQSRDGWEKLFKQTFKFTGGKIVNEFLMSIGYLPGSHEPGCKMYKKVLKKNPMWLRLR